MRQQKALKKNMPVPVVITVYQDKSFTFTPKLHRSAISLKKLLALQKAGQTPGRDCCGQGDNFTGREIAEQKMKDLNAVDMDGAVAMISGSARAMGLDVVEG